MIDNNDDTIDSRDVINELDELQSELDSLTETVSECEDEVTTCEDTLNELQSEDEQQDDDSITDAEQELTDAQAELEGAQTELNCFDMDVYTVLKEFAKEFEDYASDYMYGAQAIRESYWEDYAGELVHDLGDLPDNLPAYIEDNINWKGVAEDLLVDYSAIDFDGVTYYVR